MDNNIIIRKPNIYDVSKMAKIHVDTWRSTYTGIIPDGYLENLQYEQSEKHFLKILNDKDQKEFLFVAETDKKIIGFAGGGKERTGNPDYSGELYGIYVSTDYLRQGCGQKLVSAIAKELFKSELYSMMVWVLLLNPFKAFYEKLQGVKVSERDISIGGIMLKEIAYGWKDVQSLPVGRL